MTATTRATRTWGLTLAMTAVAGCSFDGAVPGQAIVRCASADDCRSGTFCQRRLGRCLPIGGDTQAPSLVSARAVPSLLDAGTTLSFEVVVTEAPLEPPVVVLTQGGRRVALALRSLAAEAQPRFLLGLDAGVASEGAGSLSVSLVDEAGNEALELPAGDVRFDFTPPRVVAVQLELSGDAGRPRVSPGAPLIARALFSEPLAAAPALTARAAGCPDVAFPLSSTGPGVFEGRALAPQADGCAYGLSLGGLVDVAGNEAPAAAVPTAFDVDGRAPPIFRFEVTRPIDGGSEPASVFSRVPPFDTLELTVDFRADDGRATFLFDGLPLDACATASCEDGDAGRRCRCRRAVTVSDRAGPHAASVAVIDEAGNVATQSISVSFDFQPPSAVAAATRLEVVAVPGCAWLPTRARRGGAVRATVALDEPGQASFDPVDSGVRWTAPTQDGAFFTFSGVVSAAAVEGAHPVLVHTEDRYGNAGLTAIGSVEVDATPPAAPRVDWDGGLVLRRFPWGDERGVRRFELLAPAGSLEAGALLRTLESDDGGLEIGRGVASDAGAALVSLLDADRVRAFAQQVDSACLEGPLTEVLHGEWHASLGSVAPRQPHQATHLPEFHTAVARGDARAVAGLSLGVRDGQLASVSGEATWRARQRPAAEGVALAYDSARARVVSFGGVADALHRETWEWDGQQWHFGSATGPSARFASALAFDEGRGVAVLFGGTDYTTRFADTWEWDGSAWVRRATTGPAGREFAGLCFDSRRNVTVLFGGDVAGVGKGNDTWEWDGGSWARRDVVGPSPRSHSGLAYDARRGVSVLFGGESETDTLGDTWEYDGLSWRLRADAGPSPRSGHTLAFDEAAGTTVMVGGSTGAIAGRHEVWEWNGVQWTPAGALPDAGRAVAASAYARAWRALVHFGGYELGPSAALWERSDAGWRRLDPPAPPARGWHSLTYDPQRGQAIDFGGQTDQGYARGTWAWDGVRWQALPGPHPSPRLMHQAAYDSCARELVLLGGSGEAEPYDYTDAWGLTDAGWQPRPSLPWARSGGALVQEPGACNLWLLGGTTDAGAPASNAQRASGGAWTELDAGPTLRSEFGLAVDDQRGIVHVVGGQPNSSLNQASREQWSWQAGTWTARTLVGPVGRYAPSLVQDVAGDRLLLFGGYAPFENVELDDLWSYDGAAWRAVAAGPGPGQRRAAAITYDPRRQLVVMTGGYGNLVQFLDEVWEFGLQPDAKPALAMRFDVSALGDLGGGALRTLELRAVAGGTGGAGEQGAEVWVGRQGRYRRAGSSSFSAAAPGLLSAASPGPMFEPDLLEQGFVWAALAPAAGNRTGSPARLSVDWVELVVEYSPRP